MLPFITEEIRDHMLAELKKGLPEWRKKMIHHVKEENPEINSAIIEAANLGELDAKSVATGAYMVYKMLEISQKETDNIAESLTLNE